MQRDIITVKRNPKRRGIFGTTAKTVKSSFGNFSIDTIFPARGIYRGRGSTFYIILPKKSVMQYHRA